MRKKAVFIWLILVMSGLMALGCNNPYIDIMGEVTESTVSQDYDTTNGTQIDLSQGGVTISEPGTYVLSGTLSDGQVVVDASEDMEISLVLNGVDITCSNSAAIYVAGAKSVTIVAAEGTVNQISDGTGYSEEAINDKITGAIFSRADLTIHGAGTINVVGNYKHGIVSKGALTISDATVKIEAVKDAVHSNGNINIGEECNLTISAGDDGIHTDANLTINGGDIVIAQSYEGLEGKLVTVNKGRIDVTSSDDGINAAGGDSTDMSMDKSGNDKPAEDGETGIVINGGTVIIDAGGDGVDSNGFLEINGGVVYVNGPESNGDTALDFEARCGGKIHGGTVVAVGSSGMVENMSIDSKQCVITVFMESIIPEGVELTVKDSSGKVLMSYTPAKNWQCAILSHSDIKQGETYTITAGDTVAEVTVESAVTTYGQGNMNGGFGNWGNGGKGDFGEDMRPEDFNFKDMPQKPENLPR